MSRLFISIVLVASALSAAAPPASAASLIVCPTLGGPCAYTSIQTAIDAALPGDTVVVRPGDYAEAILIDESITVCSTTASGGACNANADETTLVTNAIYPVRISADDAVFAGFTIDNSAFTLVDVGTAWVDPSAIVITGDRVVVRDNVIAAIASQPLPGESRAYTIGINIGETGASTPEDVEILRNTMTVFPRGYLGSCLNAPCLVAGVYHWDTGDGLRVHDNDIRLGGASEPAAAVKFSGIDDVVVTSNFLRLPSSQPGGAIGVDMGITDGAIVSGNDIATTLSSTPGGLYGIWCICSDSEFVGNKIQLAHHGLGLRSSVVGGNLVEDNEFLNSNQGVLNYADNTQFTDNLFDTVATAIVLDHVDSPGGPYSSSENVVLRENRFRTYTTSILLTDTMEGIYVDARENDWGAYTSANIALRQTDNGVDNELDISCFIDNDGSTRVCPTASFTKTVSGTTWPRTVTLRDTSTYSGSEFASRNWTIPVAPGYSEDENVTLALGPGIYSFVLEVTDAEGFTSTASQGLVITNAAPAIDVLDAAASENVPFSLALAATDADGDDLTYTLVSGPAGASIANGALVWTPTHAQAGPHAVEIEVSDGLATASDTATITVTDVPVGAVFDPTGALALLEGETKAKTVRATSPGGSAIALTLDSGPGAFVDNGDGTGTLTYTAAPGSTGVYPVVVNATSEGITTQLGFNVVVTSLSGVGFTKVTPTIVQTSPGMTVYLNGTIKNTGTGPDSYRVTSVSSRPGWTMGSVADVPLAAGASGAVSVPVTLPLNGDRSFITVKVCSVATPTTCATQQWRVEVPILVTVNLEETYGILDTISGTIVVKFLNGAVAEGVRVFVTESSDEDLPGFEDTVDGTTDATGTFAFSFDSIQSKFLGGHSLFVSAKRGDMQVVVTDHYDIEI